MVLVLFVCVGADLVDEVYLSECVYVFISKSGQGIGLFFNLQNKFRVRSFETFFERGICKSLRVCMCVRVCV